MTPIGEKSAAMADMERSWSPFWGQTEPEMLHILVRGRSFLCKLRIRVHEGKVRLMSIHPIMQKLAAKLQRTDLPDFKAGDTVRVQVKIKEGEKERLQAFEGMVISLSHGPQASFTVRKMSFGQGVERIFPFNSKVVDKVEKVRSYEVRRSKLCYLRGLRGKAARLREVARSV